MQNDLHSKKKVKIKCECELVVGFSSMKGYQYLNILSIEKSLRLLRKFIRLVNIAYVKTI